MLSKKPSTPPSSGPNHDRNRLHTLGGGVMSVSHVTLEWLRVHVQPTERIGFGICKIIYEYRFCFAEQVRMYV